jgi:hypothetical protein
LEHPIFYFKKLSKANVISLLVYLGVSFALYYFCKKSSSQSQQFWLFFYSFLTPFFLYLFGYVALRNLTYYFLWVIIAIIHFAICWQIKDDQSLFMYKGSAAPGLKSTIFALVLFQILRFASLKIQYQELVAPSRGSRTDLYDERKINFLDMIFFLVYIGSVLALVLI